MEMSECGLGRSIEIHEDRVLAEVSRKELLVRQLHFLASEDDETDVPESRPRAKRLGEGAKDGRGRMVDADLLLFEETPKGGDTSFANVEGAEGGAIARLRDGDVIRLDAEAGRLDVLVPASEWEARDIVTADLAAHHEGCGRELFSPFRAAVSGAETGATIFALV